MRQTNVRGSLSLRGFRKLRTGAIVATGVILLGLGFLAPTVSASEQDGVWVARTVAEVKADLQKEGDLFKYVIKWGDTLSVISEASNIPVDVLQEMNQASGKNLFLPHNELYFTEAETVSDTVTKHKIVIKESGASGEVRTYEVLLKKDQETKAVTFELTDVTEKVEKMTVNYSPVYQPVSAPVVERAEESGEEPASETSAETRPEVKEETEAPVAPKAEDAATAPAPKAEEPAVPAPKADEPAVGTTPKADEPAAGTTPKADEPAAGTTPKADEPAAGTTPKADEPAAGTTPKAEEPAAGATSKADEPAAGATSKADEPAAGTTPKAEEPAAGATPKADEPTASAPKDDESASSVESPSTSNHSEESGAPSTTPTGDSTATQPSDSTSSPVTPSEEAPVTSGDTNSTAQPAGETGNSETTAEPSNTPSADPTNESGNAAESSSVTDNAPSNTGTTEQPVASNPSSEEPTASAPKNDESGSSVESPSIGNHSDESGTPSTTPTGDSTATQPSDSTSSPVTPSEEAPVTSGEPNSTTQPAGETGNSETTAEPSNTPSADPTNESGNAAESSSVTDNAPSNTGAADQPVASNSSSESPATSTPKAEEPATTEPKAEELTSEEAKAKKELADAQKDGEDIINERVSSKLGEIEKVKDEAEKEKLKAELKTLKEDALAAINNAKDHDAAVAAADEYQTKIDEINVPGEELPAPNYNKDNLSNGRNEGTTIDNGSTAIGHGASDTPSTSVTKPTAESPATATTSPTSSAQPTNESSASTGTQPAATSETSSFRKAPEVQVRARRVARAVNQPDGTVNISYNYDGMPDINGFLSDPGENNTVAISNSATEDEVKELVKAKIQAKAQELAKHGYKVKEEIVFEQDTNVKNFNYVVTFTKEKTGTTGFRIAPEVQVRAKKVVKRDLSNKTKQINIYYNLTNLKDIAGALGEVGENNMLTLSGNATKEEIKKAIEEKTKSQIEKLNKQGFKVTSTTDLNQIVEGGDSYDYVVEFTKESKSTSVNNTGFRKAPLVQKRAKRSAEVQETVDVNIYFNLKSLPGIAGALDVDGDTTIKLPKNATEAQVKAAIQEKIAKVEKRGYKVSDFYFGAKTDRGYDFVVEFKK